MSAMSLPYAGAQVPAISDYIALLKPRVMALVTFTGWVGMMLAPGQMHPLLATIAVLCIAVGAGAAGAINMWVERHSDKLMKRTASRPLPAGRMAPEAALEFGVVLSAGSVLMMWLCVNLAAAALLLAANLFYVFIYTMWLKPRTPQNIVIGGAAGAFPPMIGWAAVSGSIGVEALILFALIFFWTPPHFWALALVKNEDYKKAGIPMLPVVAGDRVTKIQMVLYAMLLIPLSIAPTLIGMSSAVYGLCAGVMSVIFAGATLGLCWDHKNKYAMRLFAGSILYLFALFLMLLIDGVL